MSNGAKAVAGGCATCAGCVGCASEGSDAPGGGPGARAAASRGTDTYGATRHGSNGVPPPPTTKPVEHVQYGTITIFCNIKGLFLSSALIRSLPQSVTIIWRRSTNLKK